MIFTCHFLDQLSLSAQQVSSELTSDKPVESPSHIVWLLMMLQDQGYVVLGALWAESQQVDPAERISPFPRPERVVCRDGFCSEDIGVEGVRRNISLPASQPAATFHLASGCFPLRT